MLLEVKHGEMSSDDYRISKQDFRVLEKLTQCPLYAIGPTGRMNGRDGLLIVDSLMVTSGIRDG